MAELNTAILVSAIMRRASSSGGFAMQLKRGDDAAGALLLIAREKGRIAGVYEQILTREGVYQWSRFGPQTIENEEEIDEYLTRRKARDPDVWIIELDIPDVARFIAELPLRA